MSRRLPTMLLGGLLLFSMVGCPRTTRDTVGETVEEVTDEVGDAVEEVADEVDDATN